MLACLASPRRNEPLLLQTCARFSGSYQLFLLETGDGLPASPEGTEPVSVLPASGCPLGAVTAMSNEEGNDSSDCLVLLFVPKSPGFLSLIFRLSQ